MLYLYLSLALILIIKYLCRNLIFYIPITLKMFDKFFERIDLMKAYFFQKFEHRCDHIRSFYIFLEFQQLINDDKSINPIQRQRQRFRRRKIFIGKISLNILFSQLSNINLFISFMYSYHMPFHMRFMHDFFTYRANTVSFI